MTVAFISPINVLDDAVIALAIALIITIVGCFAYAITAMVNNQPVLPWGPRSKAAQAKALTDVAAERLRQAELEAKSDVEVAQQHLEREALELKLTAFRAKHEEVKKVIADGKELNLPELLAKVPERHL